MVENAGDLEEEMPPEPWIRRAGATSFDILCIAGVAALVILLLVAARTLVLPLIVAALLGMLFAPLVDGLARWRFPRWLGTAVVMVLILALFVGLVAMIIYGVATEAVDIADAVQTGFESLKEDIGDTELGENIVTWLDQASNRAWSTADGGLISTLFKSISSVATLFIGMFLGIFILFFLLKDFPTIEEWLIDHSRVSREKAQAIFDRTSQSIRQYFWGTTIIAAVNAVTIMIAVIILDIPLVGVITVVTFVTAYIPSIGGYIGGAFAVLIALGSNGIVVALILLVVEILANTVIQNPVQAVAYGATLNLNPLAVLIVTTLGAIFAGVAGAILAAPLAAVVANVYREFSAASSREALPVEEVTISVRRRFMRRKKRT